MRKSEGVLVLMMKILKILGAGLAATLLVLFYTEILRFLMGIGIFALIFKLALVALALMIYGTVHHVLVTAAAKTTGKEDHIAVFDWMVWIGAIVVAVPILWVILSTTERLSACSN